MKGIVSTIASERTFDCVLYMAVVRSNIRPGNLLNMEEILGDGSPGRTAAAGSRGDRYFETAGEIVYYALRMFGRDGTSLLRRVPPSRVGT
jgi:hypothetical protein